MKKNRKLKMMVLPLLLVMNVALVGAVFFLMNTVQNMLDGDTRINLTEIVNQNKNVITSKVFLDINNLRLVAEKISETRANLGSSEVFAILQSEADEKNIEELSVTDINGITHVNTGAIIDISGRLYFKLAIEGTSNISERIISRTTGDDIYICCVPLYRDGKIIGTVQKIYSVDMINDIFALSLFSDKGEIYVINGNGDVIIHTDKNRQTSGSNYYRDLFQSGNQEASKNIREDLKNNKSGSIEITKGGEKVFSAYTPIESVHDWFIISSVPIAVVSPNGSLVIKIFYGVLLVVIIIITSILSYIIWSKEQYSAALEKMAFVDGVTNGDTYNKFVRDAADIFSKFPKNDYSVIKFDIDNFKYINEFYGFAEGDKVLAAIYRHVKSQLNAGETIARTTGDNFLLLLERGGMEKIQKILDFSCAECLQTNVNFTCSVGIYEVSNKDEVIASMMDKAAIAAQTVKGVAIKYFAIYNDKLREKTAIEERIKMVMHAALANDEFKPYYQAKVNIFTGEIVGAEVLVRWKSPERIIPPGEFIPVFEKNGFVVAVDMCMFERVCAMLRSWLDAGKKTIPISVNFSRVHLHDKNFLPSMKEMVKKYALPPNLIEVELTESAIFDNMDIIRDFTDELHKTGFIVTMDDFGSGYSSLNMLKEIPIDVLKIDKDFLSETENIERRDIVFASIIELAHKLDIEVIAEGVEFAENVELMKRSGCSIAQGYYFAKPIPQDEFEQKFFENSGGL